MSQEITIGDIRKAIDGLPDDSVLWTSTHYVDELGDSVDVSLVGFKQEEAHCVVQLEVRELDPYGDDDEGDDGDDDDEVPDGHPDAVLMRAEIAKARAILAKDEGKPT